MDTFAHFVVPHTNSRIHNCSKVPLCQLRLCFVSNFMNATAHWKPGDFPLIA